MIKYFNLNPKGEGGKMGWTGTCKAEWEVYIQDPILKEETVSFMVLLRIRIASGVQKLTLSSYKVSWHSTLIQ